MFVAVHELVYFKCMPLGDVRYVLVVTCSFKSFSLSVITVQYMLCACLSLLFSLIFTKIIHLTVMHNREIKRDSAKDFDNSFLF